ncbi:MAG: AAA domain-containing protein [Pseudonocardia sp.]|nr:AAA domain-containing protein [Pseudonocardia sp.]
MRLADALRRALRAGPVTQHELMTALEQLGQGKADVGSIWQTCQEHGLADLVNGRWVPRGWAPPDNAPSGVRARREPPTLHRVRRPDPDGLGPLARRKINELRTGLGLTQPAERLPAPVPEKWPDVVREAVGALVDELSEVTRKRTQTDVPLRAGHVVATGETRALMRFEADGEVTAREGTEATLVLAPGEAIPVEIVSVFAAVVTLSLPKGAQSPPTATLRCDLSWLLSAQSRRLNELAGGAPGFDPAAALAVVTPTAAPARAIPDGRRWGMLNETQSLAVSGGLRDGTTWLWGPPGTGKTTTLSVLVHELHRRGLRTLLTAPTNTAVDIALRETLKQLGATAPGSVIRVGQPTDARLVRRPDGQVLVEEVAERRGSAAAAELTATADLVRSLRGRLQTLEKSGRSNDKGYVSLQLELAENQAYLRALRSLLSDVRRQVCQEALLVAATAHQLTMPTLQGMAFDVVVIDEASMLPATLTMLAAGAGHGHTVVAGDFRQLPPVVVAGTTRVNKWLRRSAFEASGVAGLVARRTPPANLVALTEQHRMPEMLAEAISDGFYPESRLRTAGSVRRRPAPPGLRAMAPIVCVDTSALRSRAARRGGLYSRYNLLDALLSAALVADHGLTGPEPALITPFAPQARLLQALVGDDEGRGVASTVHRFQGAECNVVIFDAVEAVRGGMKLHPWFGEPAGSDGSRLVNVAMSRARERLIILADFDRIHRKRAHKDAVGDFLKSALGDGDYLNPLDVIAGRRLGQSDLQRMSDDIDRANSTIEIWSERIDDGRVAPLVPHLADSAKRGCTTTVWFHPTSGGDVPPGLAGLRYSDVLLRPCTPVRESLAVLGDVVWASSDALLGPAPGTIARLDHADLAAAVLRVTRRRDSVGIGGSGRPADTCRCGRLQIRDETGPYAQPSCRVCDADRQRHRAGRR